MLELKNIKKDYPIDKATVTHALKGISLTFPDKGFVAILGPSGCGKTTLLNIVSGLDRYTEGDLIIDGVSTSKYKDKDWDDYRNKKVGMIFQSYNLIPHLTISENVALPLTLAGVNYKVRKEKALIALEAVGLKDQAEKKPNQLSGGQQQRVAIARSIINDPSILLADEPTGALDSVTSIQVMDILLDLSKSKLIVMVTHNQDLAYKYADRIIKMKDGLVLSDELNNKKVESKSVEEKINDKELNMINSQVKGKQKKSRMNFWTAFLISFKNLLVKKGRTILTSIASSFGIIGIGLVLAVSNGFTDYVQRNERESLDQFPITVNQVAYKTDSFPQDNNDLPRYPDEEKINVYNPSAGLYHFNTITSDYYNDYLGKMDPKLYNSILLSYSASANIITQNGPDSYRSINTSSSSGLDKLMGGGSSWSQLPGDKDFILSQYDYFPINNHEFPSEDDAQSLVLVVDTYNRVTTGTLSSLGFDTSTLTNGSTIDFNTLTSKTYRQFTNDEYYAKSTDETKKNTSIAGINMVAGKNYNDFLKAIVPLLNMNDSSNITYEDLEPLLECFVPKDVMDKYENDKDSLTAEFFSIYAQFRLSSEYIKYKAAATDEEKAALWTPLLQRFVTIIGNDKNLKIRVKTQLDTYVAPNNTQLKNLYNYGKRDATESDPKIKDDSEKNIHIVGILRPKKTTIMGVLGSGVYYTKALIDRTLKWATGDVSTQSNDYFMLDLTKFTYKDYKEYESKYGSLESNMGSMSEEQQAYLANIAASKLPTYYDIFSAKNEISMDSYQTRRGQVGADTEVSSISIYPKDFDSKKKVLKYLDGYNTNKPSDKQIMYTDAATNVLTAISTMVNVISTVLIIFASISLVVSSVMIGIIIYVSVIERTKEIGTLRSIGARKKDVSNLFVMESVSIGTLAGLIGILMTYLISIPINITVNHIYMEYNVGNIAFLNPLHAFLLVVLSASLTFIAGLIPARMAGRKDPVKCLRNDG